MDHLRAKTTHLFPSFPVTNNLYLYHRSIEVCSPERSDPVSCPFKRICAFLLPPVLFKLRSSGWMGTSHGTFSVVYDSPRRHPLPLLSASSWWTPSREREDGPRLKLKDKIILLLNLLYHYVHQIIPLLLDLVWVHPYCN